MPVGEIWVHCGAGYRASIAASFLAAAGRRLKLRYMTQAKIRPPSFIVFASRPDALPESYQRYLVNGLREAFDMPGTPIRLWVRGGKNPYAKD